MKVAIDFLLGVFGGNANNPSAKNIIGAVGADVDEESIDLLLKEASGRDIAELISKLASVPSGGGVAVSAAPSSGGCGAFVAEEKKEAKKEEKEESDEDLAFTLFD